MNSKSKKQLDDIEQSILEKDFERTSELLIQKGYRELADLANTLNDIYPYMDSDKDSSIIIDFLLAYRKQKSPIKKKMDKFTSLKEAMQKFKISSAYSAKDELLNSQKEKAKEKRRIADEAKLLQPQTEFNPLPITTRIGVVSSDVILIGDSKKIIKALGEYDYICEIFSINQLIVRNVTLLGIREDSLYIPEQHDIKKKKIKYDDWKSKVKEKRQAKRFFISQISKIVDRVESLEHRKIVVKQIRRYKKHYYILLLPRTVISKPYCRERMGRLIPIIYEWDMLVV